MGESRVVTRPVETISSAGFYRSRKILKIHRFSPDKMPAEQVLLLFSNQKALLCQNIILCTFCVSLLLKFL